MSIDDDAEIDFSSGRRGAVLPSTGKRRITIRIDNEILDWFRDRAERAGGGSYQTMINDALRDYVAGQREPLAEALRRVIREEMAQYVVSSKGGAGR
jgi:predicted DNA binding CopG/RHH family protein